VGDDGAFVTRIYYNPLISWIWSGIAIMVAGGLLSLTDRRYRVGAPVRRSAAASPAVGAAS